MTENSFLRKLGASIVVILLMLLLWFFRHWFMLAFLSILLAVGLSIPINSLRKRGLSRGPAMAISSIGFFLVLSFLTLWIVPTFIIQSFEVLQTLPQQFPIIQELINENLSTSEVSTDSQLSSNINNTKTEIVNQSNLSITQNIQMLWQENQTIIKQAAAILPKLFKGFATTGKVLGQIVFSIFLSLLLLATPYAYLSGSLYLVPKDKQQRLLEIWQALYKTLTTWLSALSFSITITMILVWLILGLLIGMPNALLVAVIAGLATFIPNIGNFIPLLPIAVFSYTANPKMILLTIPAYLLIQLLESNVFTPVVVKAELNLPPALVLFFQVISGLLFGFLGILMAVPILATIITLVRELYSKDILGYQDDNFIVSTGPNGKLGISKPKPASKKSILTIFKRPKK